MIKRMVKVTILFHRSIGDTFLHQLQHIGVLHIENQSMNQSEKTAMLRSEIDRLSKVKELLAGLAPPVADDKATTRPAACAVKAYPGGTKALLTAIEDLRQISDQLASERIELESEIFSASRWGDFDPQTTQALEAHGCILKLYSAPKSRLSRIEQQVTAHEYCILEPVFQERSTAYFAVLSPAEQAPFELNAAEESLPVESLDVLRDRLSRLTARRQACLDQIREYVAYLPWLGDEIRRMQNELSYCLAHESLTNEVDGQVLAVTGWVPHKIHQQVKNFLMEQDVVYVFGKPEASEKVPILLTNNPVARLFEPIMRIFSLPDYSELDPTPFFAPFYTLFFGLCIADVGYGLVLTATILVALLIFKNSSMRPLFYLGLILSGSVILAGVFLDDFFGLHIDRHLGSHAFLADFILFHGTQGPMLLAIMLGVIQVIFGYVLRLVNVVRTQGPLAALKPTGVIAILVGIVPLVLHALGHTFSIGPFALGAWDADIPDVTAIGSIVAGSGLLLFLLFNSLDKRIYVRPLIGLWHFYELATGVFGDTLSYLRLFALGLSSGLLAAAIIHISLMVRGSSPLGYIPMVLVLLIGTLINLGIGLLSAFVHSLRLTFVEFYKAEGFKGGGVAYAPFRIE
jgi:V/A-type H+-transporting ATPase subunit I